MTLPKNNKLSILILEARNLPGVDFNGKSDPYIIIEENTFLKGTPYKTATVKSNVNPKWKDEKLECTFEEDYCQDIRFRIYDENLLTKDVYLGDVIVPFKRLMHDKHIDEWLPVHQKGELHVILTLELQSPICELGSEIDLTGVNAVNLVRARYAPAEWKAIWNPIIATINENKEYTGSLTEANPSLHNALTYENFPERIVANLSSLSNTKVLLVFMEHSPIANMNNFRLSLAVQNAETGAMLGTIRWFKVEGFAKDNKKSLMGYIVIDEKPRFVVLPEILHCKTNTMEGQVKEVVDLIKF